MGVLLNRGLSLLIYVGYVSIAYFKGGGGDALKIATALLLPMGCIWFPEAFGGYTGLASYQVVDTRTPGLFICVCGWFLLVGVPVLLYITMRGTS
jgi:hypothetical protein